MTAAVTDESVLDVLVADGGHWSEWAHQCHAASLRLVRTGILGPQARVARGAARGVPGQHSWAVVGDPYDEDAPIVDVTLWSYTDDAPPVWRGSQRDGIHRPHQAGNIFDWGRPVPGDGEPIELPEPDGGWSRLAATFLDVLGPLDELGWSRLARAPVGGWPAGEILTQMAAVPVIQTVIPIDVLGMATDLNPDGLYR
jgi:hypothetical protein